MKTLSSSLYSRMMTTSHNTSQRKTTTVTWPHSMQNTRSLETIEWSAEKKNELFFFLLSIEVAIFITQILKLLFELTINEYFFFVNGKTHLCMFTYVYTFCMIHVSVPCIFRKNYDVTYLVFMLISDAKWFFFAVFPLINKWNLVIIIIQNITTIVKNKLLVNCLLYAGILTRVVVSSDLLTSDVR